MDDHLVLLRGQRLPADVAAGRAALPMYDLCCWLVTGAWTLRDKALVHRSCSQRQAMQLIADAVAGGSQTELSKLLGMAGARTVRKWFAGDRTPSVQTIFKLKALIDGDVIEQH